MSEHDTPQEGTARRGPGRPRKNQTAGTGETKTEVTSSTVPTVTYDSASTAGDPVPAEELPGYELGYAAGYQQGVADSKPRPPLFEACKAAIEQLGLTPDQARTQIAGLERDYRENLSNADRDLLVGVAARQHAANNARAQAVRDLARPKTTGRRTVVDVEPDVRIN